MMCEDGRSGVRKSVKKVCKGSGLLGSCSLLDKKAGTPFTTGLSHVAVMGIMCDRCLNVVQRGFEPRSVSSFLRSTTHSWSGLPVASVHNTLALYLCFSLAIFHVAIIGIMCECESFC